MLSGTKVSIISFVNEYWLDTRPDFGFLEWQSCHFPVMVFCLFQGNLPRFILVFTLNYASSLIPYFKILFSFIENGLAWYLILFIVFIFCATIIKLLKLIGFQKKICYRIDRVNSMCYPESRKVTTDCQNRMGWKKSSTRPKTATFWQYIIQNVN